MRVLIIGDLRGQIGVATKLAKQRGASVAQAQDGVAALGVVRSKGADLILIDVQQDVKQLVDSLKQEHISVPVIGCGLNDSADDAVKAIQAGAKEYLPLPPDEALISAIFEAIADDSMEVVCESPDMKKILELVEQVAPAEASILITGESGTGKEVIARLIHNKSKRSGRDFVSVNCAAIPENLLESELFGHEKGAFTGAVARRIGKFEEANHSTLLLDEISELDIRLQAKLLRAIQEREIDRVGGKKPVKLDIRILATSNRDLQAAVKEGSFREDLLFRLNIITIELPPLRERKEDVVALARHFAVKYAEVNGVAVRPLAESAIEKLLAYHWPGNVRELENSVHRAVLLAQGDVIDAAAFTFFSELSEGGVHEVSAGTKSLVGQTVNSVEKDLILNTLEHCLGNRTKAANILGISIRTLRNKLKAYEC